MSTQFMIGRPKAGEYAPYFDQYFQWVTEDDVLAAMADQMREVRSVLDDVGPSQADTAHAPYTWTIKQVVGHLIDNENIFAYRARRFAAADPTELPGYEQNDLVANSDYGKVQLSALVDELEHHRQAFLHFCRRLPESAWTRQGTADGKRMSVRAIAYLQVGHIRHHLNILRRRLGK